MEQLKYPIGRFNCPSIIDQQSIKTWIETIKYFPRNLAKEVEHLDSKELENTYRADGWTIAQIVHHCADSHMNSFIRFKLALTEEKPVIKTYNEDRWAELSDAKHYDIKSSLQLLFGLHSRWAHLLSHMTEAELNREFIHPTYTETLPLKHVIGLYAWHCNHHLAHVINAKRSERRV